MDLGLAGQSVFIAGASRGIGLAIARAFLGEGARVAITGRNAEALATAAEGLAVLGTVIAIPGDMSEAGDISRALDEAEAKLGPLHAVVGNVGNGSSYPGYAISSDHWEQVLRTNLLSATLLAAAALPRLEAQKGSLTLISSIAGIEAIGAPVAYSVAKAGVNAAVGFYARDVGRHGVRVNAVAPGNVLFPGGTWERKLAERREFFETYIAAEVALRRFARPEEIAAAVVFLASSQASFITGTVMVVDGGQTRS